MKALALGVIQDLRARRLLPVAGLLLAALVAVPVLMLKPAESATPPVTGATVTPPPGAEGLPTPEQALQGGSKPLVSLAVLGKPSDLASFNPKDPFKPLQNLQAGLPDSTKDSGQAAAGEDAGSGAGGSGGTDTGSGAPTTGQPDSGNTAPTDPDAPGAQQKFTYTLDATLDGPKGKRRFRNMPRLRMLPSENAPLLVFLGVDAAGEKAVFLVDSTVTILEGEGGCTPARDTCATLSMEPGERQVFTDEEGQRYELQIDQINERSLASVAKASRVARKKAAAARKKLAKTAVGHNTARRFTPPVLAEILNGVQQ